MDDTPPSWEPIGVYPGGLLVPDIVFLLTVDEENRALRISGRGLAMTSEEKRLERKKEQRQEVLNLYRMFDPIEIDTSGLSAEAVFNQIMYWLKESCLIE